MAQPNRKRSAYFKINGLRVNCDGTTIIDRKPNLKLYPNHYHYTQKIHKIYNPAISGTARRDGRGWYAI